MKRPFFLYAVFTLFIVGRTNAQLDVGSDGSDGAFVFVPDGGTGNTMTIDLSQAASLCDCDADTQIDDPCRWDCPSPVTGRGVYDPQQWAIVYKWSNVDVPGGKTVRFTNHPSKAPVVWLVQQDVTIASGALVSLLGPAVPQNGATAEPGPGGFRGGRDTLGQNAQGSGGFGPGGGDYTFFSYPIDVYGSEGSYGTAGGGNPVAPTYGNSAIVPLLGGSGGADRNNIAGGSAGGGAILIAAGSNVVVNGTIDASSTWGGTNGSGGAIRIIGEAVTGTGVLRALSGFGPNGAGRIRIEAFTNSLSGSNPAASFAEPTIPPTIWPPPTGPTVRVNAIDYTDLQGQPQTVTIPADFDPRAALDYPFADIAFETDEDITFHIEATNMPLDWIVKVRVVPKAGNTFSVTAGPLSGTVALSTTTAATSFPGGFSAVQVRAAAP